MKKNLMISPFYKKHNINIRIHVFKTNIETEADISIIKVLFNSFSKIKQWSIDLEDIDNVLRIEATKNLSQRVIIQNVKSKGFYCEELD
ncbi:hypothetical protein [Psychroserpens ponticola]|uniref:HMA domain-containing protein n=1 Tax=Psychroserpens ponticola TaxID=2932268 RepID=A0ABY7RVE5_9FLAO|nr:hypothetical protein [Psychroserpens ponticola]WCO00948.1 hypothetical protein MUN68_012825 [Psychroserpens ponticola]